MGCEGWALPEQYLKIIKKKQGSFVRLLFQLESIKNTKLIRDLPPLPPASLSGLASGPVSDQSPLKRKRRTGVGAAALSFSLPFRHKAEEDFSWVLPLPYKESINLL